MSLTGTELQGSATWASVRREWQSSDTWPQRSLPFSVLAIMMVTAIAFAAGADDVEGIDEAMLFQSDRLMEVQLTVAENDWERLCAQTRPMAIALSKGERIDPFGYFPADCEINGVAIPSVSIRKKGFIGSLDEERPSLKLDVGRDVAGRTVAGMRRLTLNNNKQDESLVSQHLAYRLFRRAGVEAPRTAFVKLVVNGKSLGIYSHVESVDERYLQRRFAENRTDWKAGPLYEGTLADLYPAKLARLEAKNEAAEEIPQPIKTLSELLWPNDGESAKALDDLQLQQIEELVDLESFLAFWAVESSINFWDGYSGNQNNFFIYVSGDNKLYFMPWGADATFSDQTMPFMPSSKKSVKTQGLLANRLYQNESVRSRYRKQLLELLETTWDATGMLAELDHIERMVADELHEDQGRFSGALQRVRQFIKARPQAIRDEIKEGPVAVSSGPRKPWYFRHIGSVSGSFATIWKSTEEQAAPNDDGADEGEAVAVADPLDELDEKPVLRCKLVLDGNEVALHNLQVTVGPGTPFGGPGGGGRRGGPGNNESPPAITVSGTRSDNGKSITAVFGTHPSLFASELPEPVMVQGMMMQSAQNRAGLLGGFFGGFNNQSRMLAGTIRLSQAGRNDGDKVEGTFELGIYEMNGSPFGG